MPATDGKILLTANSATCEIPLPSYGYKTIIRLPWDIQELDDGSLAAYDHGNTSSPKTVYDVRVCECTSIMSATEANAFLDWYKDSTKGRGVDATIDMTSNSGFHPFGPDKGDVGQFTVSVEVDKQPSMVENPYLHFPIDIRFTNTGAWPSYSLPTEVSEGVFTIGAIGNNRFPPDWFRVDGRYGSFVTHTQNATAYYMDKGTGADWFRSVAKMVSNESKCAAVINYITGTVRTGALSLVVPGEYKPFGADIGSDTIYITHLIKDVIEITHKKYNEFEYDLMLEYVSSTTS